MSTEPGDRSEAEQRRDDFLAWTPEEHLSVAALWTTATSGDPADAAAMAHLHLTWAMAKTAVRRQTDDDVDEP